MLKRKISSTTKRKIKVKCYKVAWIVAFSFFAIFARVFYALGDYWKVVFLSFFALFIFVGSILLYFIKKPHQKRIIREMVDNAGMIGYIFSGACVVYLFYTKDEYLMVGSSVFWVLIFLANIILKYFPKNKKKT